MPLKVLAQDEAKSAAKKKLQDTFGGVNNLAERCRYPCLSVPLDALLARLGVAFKADTPRLTLGIQYSSVAQREYHFGRNRWYPLYM